MISARRIGIVVLLCVFTSSVFAETNRCLPNPPAGTLLPAKALQPLQEAWKNYVDQVRKDALPNQIQKNCEPHEFSPKPNVPYKGVVVLFHGLLQCPNRFDTQAKALAEQGFEVLLPLLPGHGKVGDPTPLDGMPKAVPHTNEGGVDGYMALGCQIDTILSKEPKIPGGVNFIGGHSVGGDLATAVAEQEMMQDKKYKKCPGGKTIDTHFNALLLYGPAYKLSLNSNPLSTGDEGRAAAALYGAGAPIQNLAMTQMKPILGCESLKLGSHGKEGKGGTCANVPLPIWDAVTNIGNYAFNNRANLANKPMQVVTAGALDSEGDGTVDNVAVTQVANPNPCASLCNLDGAGHDYFTDNSNPPQTNEQFRATADNCSLSFFAKGENCAQNSNGKSCAPSEIQQSPRIGSFIENDGTDKVRNAQ